MKTLPWIILIVATLVLAGYFVLRADTIAPEEEIDVATTIFPVYDMTQNIVGDTLTVDYILPAGASPHTYEPTPRDLRALENASVLYTIHENFDGWAVPLGTTNGIDVLDLSTTVELMEFADNHADEEEHGHEEGDDHHDDDHNDEDKDDHGHVHEGDDPHYWLSFDNAMVLVNAINADLSERFPEHAAVFADNTASYLEALEDAKRQAEIALTAIDNPHLITMHTAWAYFADGFDLEIVGTFEPDAGENPTPRQIEALIALSDQYEITTIYSEPQLSEAAVESFASDANLAIAVLDPLGGLPGRESYIDLMLYNVNTIADAQ